LKFIPGRTVLGEGSVDYRDKQEAGGSPLALRLFDVEGVSGVFLGSDFISVTKSEGEEWQHIKPAILGAIMDHYISGAPAMATGRDLDGAAGEDYDPEDEETVATIKELLDTRVRPAVANDGAISSFTAIRTASCSCTCAAPAPAARVRRQPCDTASKICCGTSVLMCARCGPCRLSPRRRDPFNPARVRAGFCYRWGPLRRRTWQSD
jgi:hypothetical protein